MSNALCCSYTCSIQGDTRHSFTGDRTKDDIVGFAVRMAAPPVQHLASQHELQALRERSAHLFFLYAGNQDNHLWVCFKIYILFIVSDALFSPVISPKGDVQGRKVSISPYPHTPSLVQSLSLYQQLFNICTPSHYPSIIQLAFLSL